MRLAVGAVGLVLLAPAVALSVAAQSLKDRKAQVGAEQALESEVAYTNQVCNSTISASVDWSSFDDAAESGSDPSARCDVALSAIENLCADEKAQAAVRERVQQVVCSKGEARDVNLTQGTLWVRMNGPSGDDFEFVRTYLEDTIGPDDASE